jgi:hypothetical protein
MDVLSVEVLVPLGFFLFIIVLVYLGHQKKIRLALIEKGLDPDTFKNESHQNTAARVGLFMAAVGVGILIANGIAALGWLSEDVAFLSMFFIFGGAALIGSGFINKKN